MYAWNYSVKNEMSLPKLTSAAKANQEDIYGLQWVLI